MDDLINRQNAIDVLGEEPEVWTDNHEYVRGMRAQWKYTKYVIENLPSAQKKGEWIFPKNSLKDEYWIICNQCGEAMKIKDYRGRRFDFCPWCGADMRKTEREERVTDTEKNKIKEICEFVNIKDIGELSDGFHTFNGLYKQRRILFAALVRAYKDRAWKSFKHEDGELCFGGGWFIVGIDTPNGSYTYHYENDYWNLFDCVELECGKHWDGHSEKDVTRLLSLSPVQKKGEWIPQDHNKTNGNISTLVYYFPKCSECGSVGNDTYNYCPNCGADMRGLVNEN